MHQAAEEQAALAGVDGRQLLVDRIDRAEHPPLPIAGERVHDPLQDALSGLALREIEANEQDRGNRKRARDGLRQTVACPERDQNSNAQAGKQKLRDRLDQDVDDDACCCERPRNAAEHDEPRPDEVAADLHQRQERIGRLANEAYQYAGAE